MKEVMETVLNYAPMKEYLEKKPDQKPEVEKMIKEIAGDFSGDMVLKCIKFIDATFAKLYDGVSFVVPEDFDLKKLSEENHIVLVPNHQSHADYIALTYVIYGVYALPLYIAGGINLNVFPIGNIFRKGGAFFIRRSFNNNMTYKQTFEAYIHYLLKNNLMIEFFFEGGRSRTGKLLSPKFGLFSMLLEAHSKLENAKPLMFVPVTLAHEQVPESSSHVRELWGAKKKKESTRGLLKIFKVFKRKLGTIHVRFSPGIKVEKYNHTKEEVQKLAFDCFTAIGKGMPITPMSLLSLIMLDDPSGALTWIRIQKKARKIMDYCEAMRIPFSSSLEPEKREDSLKHALEILEDNKKIEVIIKESLNEIFYSIDTKARAEMLYFKNMIIHHFLFPGIMVGAWVNVKNGSFKTNKDLNAYLMTQRKELKYEFYLPTVKDFFYRTLEVVSYALGEKIEDINEVFKLDEDKLLKLGKTLKLFSTSFVYLYEAYFLASSACLFLSDEKEGFEKKKFLSVAKDLHEIERENGRFVNYYESYTVPMLSNSLEFLINQGAIERENGQLKVVDKDKLKYYKEKFAKDINDHINLSLI
jgi:glycerol-3-phosphate O-acyltransferase